jgi:hypothetical protein
MTDARPTRTSATANHPTGTRDVWLPARLDLLQAEKEHSRRGDELARRQQALPWVRIDKTYRFDTEAMTSTAGAERCAATDGIKAVSFGAPFAPFSPFVNPPLVVASRNSATVRLWPAFSHFYAC